MGTSWLLSASVVTLGTLTHEQFALLSCHSDSPASLSLFPLSCGDQKGASSTSRHMAPRALTRGGRRRGGTRGGRRRGGRGGGGDGSLDALLDGCLEQLLLRHTCRLQLLFLFCRLLLLRTFRRYPERLSASASASGHAPHSLAPTPSRSRAHARVFAALATQTAGCTVHSALRILIGLVRFAGTSSVFSSVFSAHRHDSHAPCEPSGTGRA